jgi:hypothetical protein
MFALGLVVTTLAACSQPTADTPPEAVSYAVTSNERSTDLAIVGNVTNDCTGEVGTGTGHVHIVTTSTDDGAGGMHGAFHLTAAGKVTFGTETRYVFHQSQLFQFNSKVGEMGTIIGTFTLNGQGGAPNEVFPFRLHFTVTPNGAVPTDWEWDVLKCG